MTTVYELEQENKALKRRNGSLAHNKQKYFQQANDLRRINSDLLEALAEIKDWAHAELGEWVLVTETYVPLDKIAISRIYHSAVDALRRAKGMAK